MEINLCFGCMEEKPQPGPCPHCGFDREDYHPAVHHLPPGTILAGKYLLGRVLGEGGFGITYVGWDLNLQVKVAVKEYYPNGFVTRNCGFDRRVTELTGREGEFFRKGLERFIREAQVLGQFWELPGIVSVKDYFQENKTAYIVMEFVEGQTLKELLKKSPGSRLPVERVLSMMRPVMNALEEVHKAGLIHRDISPDNLMVSPKGEVKLIDFGAARNFLGAGEKSLSVLLKPGYAPQEQYRSRGEQGPWTDVYGLCATIYRAITGQVPEEALDRLETDKLQPPSRLGAEIGPRQEKLLMRGLALSPRDRIQSMKELEKICLQGKKGLNEEQRRYLRKLSIYLAVTITIGVLAVVLTELRVGKSAEGTDRENVQSLESQEVQVIWADSNMERLVRQGLNRPEGAIYESELEEITVLCIAGNEVHLCRDSSEENSGFIFEYENIQKRDRIQSLEDLRYFPNLERLQLSSYHVTEEMLVDLAGLKNLKQLDLEGNGLSDISALAEYTGLTVLGIADNRVKDISPLSGLVKLQELSVKNNEIEDISPLKDMKELRTLYLWENQVEDISPLSGLTELRTLYIWDNQVTDIAPLSGLTKLAKLNLVNNRVADISPLSALTELTELRLADNQVTDISPLSGLVKLQGLYMSGNRIPDISPLSGLTELTYLGINESTIEDLTPLRSLTKLEQLYVRNSCVSDLTPLSGLGALHTLDVSETQVTDIAPLAGLSGLQALNLGGLARDGRRLADLTPLSSLVNLQVLVLYENELQDLAPLSGLVNMEELSLDTNSVSDLTPLAGMEKLRILNIAHTAVSDLSPLKGFTNLTELTITDTPVTDISCLDGLEGLQIIQ
ncbi:MAG TPA: leucine-rich repeat domain-containing protein [Candidatus Egerieimonas intestinavium]|uniref:Leucine-rich repeat domain-containing protein n=1 Tax=Candidatus Egerieimonas intestinavium TaxID=2840777 RepID=A0A9D1ELK3_9FIRM|nr:leucine-rich repeat domain-containing protein [Candidatus Egerieimonas intestinavium]